MCGIAGFLSRNNLNPYDCLTRMISTLAHRGPDDCRYWIDARAGVGLGHTRLSILDLSPHGRQPMTSESGRYVVVYNGEVYNHSELRDELERRPGGPPAYRGHSDTEIVLAAIE